MLYRILDIRESNLYQFIVRNLAYLGNTVGLCLNSLLEDITDKAGITEVTVLMLNGIVKTLLEIGGSLLGNGVLVLLQILAEDLVEVV